MMQCPQSFKVKGYFCGYLGGPGRVRLAPCARKGFSGLLFKNFFR